MDQIREDPKTCPEETVYQLGTKDGHEDPALFVQVVAELVEEFMKRFGSNVQVLDWALHMDEATPHIHERHGIYVIANHESTENDAYHWKRWRRKISNRSCT